MRLKQIKLSGFKSFVDLTKVPFPHQMTAIVGPNGCGKSNIIDAVRWVLGESSAKNLRGDAMTDVIFNGASQRNAVGQASVELIFEQAKPSAEHNNIALPIIHTSSAAKLAERNEIAVRRQVNRDGLNQYSLNGSKCRRRDITDIFLGTGLGPRSYAIIEQGTISRLIESKPQELRVFIEEAAGISQYKERRRETELKINHTNENLSRLNDIRFEVEQQLEKLHIQAEAASRYKELKTLERKLKAQILALQWQQYQQHLNEFTVAIADEQKQVDASNEKIAQKLKNKQDHEQEKEQLQLVATKRQGEQLDLNQRYVIAEQKLKYNKEQTEKASTAKAKLDNQILLLNRELERLSGDGQALSTTISNQSTVLAELERTRVENRALLSEKQRHFNELNGHWIKANQQRDKYNQEQKYLTDKQLSLTQEQARVEKQLARIEHQQVSLHTEEQSKQFLHEKASLEEEIATHSDIQQVSLEDLTQSKIELDQEQQKLTQTQNEIALIDKTCQQLQQDLNQKQNWQHSQEKWLHDNRIENMRYFESVSVDSDWQNAVTMLMQQLLQGAVLEHFSTTLFSELRLEQSSFIDASALQKKAKRGTIAEKISSSIGVLPWLNNVYIADSLPSAQSLLASLEPHQSVICPDGTWLGHGFLRKGEATQQQLLLQKQQRHAELVQKNRQLQEQLLSLTAHIHALQLAIDEESTKQQDTVEHLALLKKRMAEIEHQQSAQRHKIQWQEEQLVQTEIAKSESSQRALEIKAELINVNEQLVKLENTRLQAQAFDEMGQRHTELGDDIGNIQHQIEADQSKHHHLALSIEQLKMQQIQLMQSSQHTKANIDLLLEQKNNLLDDQIKPDNFSQMQSNIKKLGNELKELSNDLSALQLKITDKSERISELESQIQESKTLIESKKNQINQAKINVQSYQVRSETLTEQLQEQGLNPSIVIEKLPPYASEKSSQRELNKVIKSLSNLGAINLAAIDEYQEHISRKNHLDLQYEDLTQAISTLESAITKIDQESRQKFKTTFEQVNQDLQILFPKVFGGGSAYLDLTSHDLLETGVTIMARPPGKKNSTIHLLSGGEKALTALSLVFAIFKLNPAPFCMLDEVDAPLDDTNVGRFCNLVREMSQTVQFIYISHNKIAMEMASHLTGVTMFEPGVSRMVSVDIDEAIAMAEVS
ncbi:chromosome segregation protein SMC [Thalassotalea atypica]|uniref:chromosome segregation protein SMC n=1 Tax=Thalassotalea atypica TaxID=2054316 RepID=UPI0025740350|nr:chromosome segregation protein SMC [Thalassotalea atypica]